MERSLKLFDTKINENNGIHIDGQFIGELKGLKFLIELTSKTLDTDIKSIKKAARKGVREEINKRVKKIIESQEISIDSSSNIIWKNDPIGRLIIWRKWNKSRKIFKVLNKTIIKSA